MDRIISIMARYMAKQCVGESEWEQHKDQVHTLVRRGLATAATAGQNSRWRRRKPATGGGWRREDDLETWRGRAGYARVKGFGKISKSWHVSIYNLTLSVWPSGMTRWHRDAKLQAVTATRCDRKVQIGCAEIENLDQLSDLGMTEKVESVRPRCTKRFWRFKSMTNRELRVLLTQSGSNLTWSNFVI